MTSQLLQWDRDLFYAINHSLTNPFFDWLMPLARNGYTWIPLYVFIIGLLLYRYKKTSIYIVVMLAITVGLSDQGSAHLIKNQVKRLRPCHEPALAATIIERVPCGSGYSFPSAHASNYFSVGCFLSLVLYSRYRWIWWASIPWAFLISFAQVYVGVHYPFDVAFGAAFGMLVACIVYLIFRKVGPEFMYRKALKVTGLSE